MRIAVPIIHSGEAGRYDYFETISDGAGTCSMCGMETLPATPHACSNTDGNPREVTARGDLLERYSRLKAFHEAATRGDAEEVARLRNLLHS